MADGGDGDDGVAARRLAAPQRARRVAHAEPRARGRVAPHGLLGQTFDGDGVPLNGRQDVHEEGARLLGLTTHAAAEGAIQGTIEDYRLPSPFATAFRYSRFDAKGAVAPRNATAMHAGLVGPKARAPAWDPAGGVDKLVPHLNFVGSDLNRGLPGRRPKAKTAEACYSACAKTRGCAAFTFITSPGFNEKARHGHDRCWLKKAGFEGRRVLERDDLRGGGEGVRGQSSA